MGYTILREALHDGGSASSPSSLSAILTSLHILAHTHLHVLERYSLSLGPLPHLLCVAHSLRDKT